MAEVRGMNLSNGVWKRSGINYEHDISGKCWTVSENCRPTVFAPPGLNLRTPQNNFSCHKRSNHRPQPP